MEEGQHHSIEVHDGGAVADQSGTPAVVEVVQVKVLAENGIFKNGKHYDAGEIAIISKGAAEGFAAVGEVEILIQPGEQDA